MVTLIAIGGIMITISARVFENMARQTQLRVDQTKAHYLAQAGVMRQIWNWYTNNTTVEGSRRITTVNTTVTGNTLFKAGMDSNGSYLQSNYAYVAPISHTGISHVRALGTTAPAKAAGVTTARTLTVAATQGDFLVVYFTMDNDAAPGGAVSCADNVAGSPNTYKIAADVVNDPGPGAGTGIRTVIFYAIVETAIPIGGIITVTHPSVTARSLNIREFLGPTHLDTAATGTALLTTGPTATAARMQYHELLVGAHGAEGPNTTTFTQGAGWTTATLIGTSGGAVDSNVTLHPQYRIATDNTDYAATGTLTVAHDTASATAAFYGRAHWFTSGANRRLRALRLQNINSANSITLTQMKVSWTGGGAAGVNDIRLNNVSVIPAGGPFTSGTTINVTDTALTFGSSWSGINTYIQWDNSGPADPTTVTCQFIFNVVAPATTATSDANSSEVILWDGAHAGTGVRNRRTFKVTATGQVNQTLGKYFKVLKTISATVSGSPALNSLEIVDWDEGEKNIP